jgi:hypothetical protein
MSDTAGVVVLIGRILFAFFFGAVAGVGHFKRDQMMRGYAQQAGFPVPAIAGWVAGLWLISGALSVAAGIWPDVGSLDDRRLRDPGGPVLPSVLDLGGRDAEDDPDPALLQEPSLPSERRWCSSEPSSPWDPSCASPSRLRCLTPSSSDVRLWHRATAGREPATRGGRRWGT